MIDKLSEIEKSALESLALANDASSLDAWRIAQLGRSSPLMQVFSGFGALSKEERPVVGQAANKVKVVLEAALAEKTEAVKRSALERSLSEEKLDVTLPAARSISGVCIHPRNNCAACWIFWRRWVSRFILRVKWKPMMSTSNC